MRPWPDPIVEVIKRRRSCRTYAKTAIALEQIRQVETFIESWQCGPLGNALRFQLVVAREQDPHALQGLGSYGFIKDPAGFIVGAVGPGEKNLEDFGFVMQAVILYATSLGLGTCWLGGSFTQSSFSQRIHAAQEEIVPAVASIGYPAAEGRVRTMMRRYIQADSRRPWETLFFRSRFGVPLTEESAGAYASPLAMVRLAPSASNRQPWRVVVNDTGLHFYLQRARAPQRGNPVFKLLRLADLQRVDIGIAMCHFQLTAEELGLRGKWLVREPAIEKPDATAEYVVTWMDES